jgi:hypothetical protein
MLEPSARAETVTPPNASPPADLIVPDSTVSAARAVMGVSAVATWPRQILRRGRISRNSSGISPDAPVARCFVELPGGINGKRYLAAAGADCGGTVLMY